MRANPQVQNKRPAERAGVDLEAARESVIAVRIEHPQGDARLLFCTIPRQADSTVNAVLIIARRSEAARRVGRYLKSSGKTFVAVVWPNNS